MSIYGKRRQRLLSAASGFDSVVVTNPKNLFYLTDFWGGGIGIVREDSTTLVTSVMEERRATESGKEVEIVPTVGKLKQYEAVLNRLSGRVLSDEAEPGLGKTTNDGELFIAVRRKKDAEEMARIGGASRRLDRIYEMLEGSIRPGRTERQVAADVMKLATEEGLSPLPAEGSLSPVIIGSGENAAFPHADLTDRKLRRGDMVVADIFFRYEGYCSDCTRTYAVGSVSQERRDAYQAVLAAQLQGIKLSKKGARGRAIHEGVNQVLKEHGLDSYFTHGTGHGVGIDIHESPSIGRTTRDILREGDVVTVEPGVYLPGKFGIRIEDTLTIGDRTRVLFGYTKDLLVLG
ncbi:MAG: M24 family metallopeptidase [Nitrososphaerales archaeon]|jgi:Xaa-Pro aminopeptidase/Xaa-Pro dipeptidase